MTLLHFSPSYNLPDTRIYTMNGFIKLLSPKFKQGWKSYFTQNRDSVIVVPDGKPYRYQIQCTSVPMHVDMAILKQCAIPINGFSSKRNL